MSRVKILIGSLLWGNTLARECVGVPSGHSSKAKCSPLKCDNNRHSALDREIHFDDEEFYSATSDMESHSADSYSGQGRGKKTFFKGARTA
eukprot:2996080-Amphidinium_carterae.1